MRMFVYLMIRVSRGARDEGADRAGEHMHMDMHACLAFSPEKILTLSSAGARACARGAYAS